MPTPPRRHPAALASRRLHSGWALTEIIAAIALSAVLMATTISKLHTQNTGQKTLIVVSQVLDVANVVSDYIQTHHTVPTARDLIDQKRVPRFMIKGNTLVHAAGGTLDIGKKPGVFAPVDHRDGFFIAIAGLDAVSCRTVGTLIEQRFPGMLVTNTSEDQKCAEACHQVGVLASTYNGDLDAYQAASGPLTPHAMETWNAYQAAYPSNFMALLAGYAQTIETNYGGSITPFGTQVKREQETSDSAFNREFTKNLEGACVVSGAQALYTVKAIGAQ